MHYEGFTLSIPRENGTYTLTINKNDIVGSVSKFVIVADKYGNGDFFKLKHVGVGGGEKKILANNIYSIPRDLFWDLLFEGVDAITLETGEKIKLVYTHVSGIEMNIFVYLTLIDS